jgi:predicted ATPase
MQMLKELTLKGYKSIRRLEKLELGKINILIGANGAGKSNFISFFKLLSWMTAASDDRLQFFISQSGGANSLLYDGAATTPQIEATLSFETDKGTNDYSIRLFHAAPDTLIFADEKYRFSDRSFSTVRQWSTLGSGHREAKLVDLAEQGNVTAKTILHLMRRCRVYQFHNTSANARVRLTYPNINDNRYLKEDAANLAPFLWRLREYETSSYRRIVETIRQITPFFADFVLEPLNNALILQWKERGSDLVFGPHQASDGTLRVMALISLLLQPEDDLPDVIILDEPELGLHPYAISVVAGLLQSVSYKAQVILATQSTNFIDHFEPEDIIVVDRINRESQFHKLIPQDLQDWLAEYSLAELWEKNVIGGRPHK